MKISFVLDRMELTAAVYNYLVLIYPELMKKRDRVSIVIPIDDLVVNVDEPTPPRDPRG